MPVILTNTHNQMQGVISGTHYANSLQAQKSSTITTKKCPFNQVQGLGFYEVEYTKKNLKIEFQQAIWEVPARGVGSWLQKE